MKDKYITIGELVKLGGLSRQAVYKNIRAGKLAFKDGRADAVKLLAEWRRKADPSRDDKIGPGLERIIRERGLAPQAPPEAPMTGQKCYSTAQERPEAARTSQKHLSPVQDATESARDGVPGHLSPSMSKFWKQVNNDFELEADALLLLRTACEAFDRAQAAREAIACDGLIVNNRRHPAVDIEAQSQSLFLRAMRQLGLDVVAPGPVGRPPGRR
jgi:phage terminase small subunit